MNACPVNIDIPWINVVVRDRVNQSEAPSAIDGLVSGLLPDEDPGGAPLARKAIAHFDTLARWGSRVAPLANGLARLSPVRWLMDRVAGIDSRRDLPELQSTTLRAWFEDRPTPVVDDPNVVLVPDTYTNYVWTERGKAAVRALETVGCSVDLAEIGDVGRPALSQGMISTATARAEAVSEALAPHLDAGRTVVFVEPTDLAMLQREYAKLLPDTEAEQLVDASRDVMSVLLDWLDEESSMRLAEGGGRQLVYHSHCQQRTLDLESPTVDVLERLGFDVTTTSAECCGMAGSFGYKSDYYELSMRVGGALREEVEEIEEGDATVVASGVSCREQLEAVLDRTVVHPVQLLVEAACSKRKLLLLYQ